MNLEKTADFFHNKKKTRISPSQYQVSIKFVSSQYQVFFSIFAKVSS